MIYPNFIKSNDIISVPAASDGCDCQRDIDRTKSAKLKLENLGYKVKLSENIFNSEKGRSASATIRAKELNEMFADNSSLIVCAAGGEFLVEALPYVDFEKISNNPKWVEGFSDPTGILFPITTKYDIATIYGTNIKSFGMRDYHRSIVENLEILKGNIVEQKSYELYEDKRNPDADTLDGYNLTNKVYWKTLDNNAVHLRGRILAGSLDMISVLAGTKYDGMKEFNEKYKDDGVIFCLDNCELSKEELIRTMWKLNELDYFKYAKAIIFGRNGVEISCLEYDMESCLKDSVISNLNIPIVYDADISHKGPGMTIINGSIATIDVKDGKATLNMSLK